MAVAKLAQSHRRTIGHTMSVADMIASRWLRRGAISLCHKSRMAWALKAHAQTANSR